MITEVLGILKEWIISSCVWLDLCNSKIAEIVSDEYSRPVLISLERIINLEVLLVEKFAVEHFAIFCLPLGKRCRSVTSYNQFVYIAIFCSPLGKRFRSVTSYNRFVYTIDFGFLFF